MPFDTRAFSFGFTTAQPFNAIYAITDLNQDGRPDVLFFPNDFGATALQVFPLGALLNDGTGTLALGGSAVFPAGAATSGATQVLVGDFNRDGRNDLFVSSLGYDFGNPVGTQNLLLLATASGGYANATATLPQVSDFTESAATADIDGDGDLDILVMNVFGGTPTSGPLTAPYFLINDGAGRFTRADDRLPDPIAARDAAFKFTSVAFLDANADGRPDLFLGTHGDGAENSQILFNDGAGRFSNPVLTPPVLASGQYSINDTLLADLDGDGRPDMVLSVAVDRYASGRIQILLNQGGGQFSDQTAAYLADPTTASAPESIQAVDVNGDGYLDLVVRRGTTRPVYLNDGQGHFVPLPSSYLGLTGDTERAAAADFNGDGRMDFLVERGSASVMLQLEPPRSQSGTAGDDALLGGAFADSVNGGAGADVLFGGGGDDSLSAGNDSDRLTGSAGNNLVYGNLGADTCDGGAGDDIVRGGQDNDSLMGGAGADFVSGDKGDDTLTGGAGADSFHTFGDAGIDRVLDFRIGEGDRVQLDPGSQYTVSQSGADTVISMTGGGQMILVGVDMASLTPGWIFGA